MRIMFGAMKVSRSAYYAWAARAGQASGREAWVRTAVKEKFYVHKRRYGARRISDELKDEGLRIGRYLTTRVMSEEGLVAKAPRRFKPRTTDSRHNKVPSPNLLKEAANTAFGAGEVIVGDITYLPMTGSRFCYLAMFQDRVTKRIVGWAVDDNMKAELVTKALGMALRRGFIKRNAIIHTDRGSQYASNEYRKLIARCSLRQSMSAKGNCYDNAQAESFFSRFKTEAEAKVFASVEQARSEAFDYIDCYYNRIRRHSAIGGTIPNFEKRLAEDATSKGCGNAAHVEIEEKQKTFSLNSPNRLEKPKNGFPTFPQPLLLDIN